MDGTSDYEVCELLRNQKKKRLKTMLKETRLIATKERQKKEDLGIQKQFYFSERKARKRENIQNITDGYNRHKGVHVHKE